MEDATDIVEIVVGLKFDVIAGLVSGIDVDLVSVVVVGDVVVVVGVVVDVVVVVDNVVVVVLVVVVVVVVVISTSHTSPSYPSKHKQT